MPIAGSLVLADLRDELEELRSQGLEIHNQYGQLDLRVKELITERGHNFLDLARHYLPEISRESIDRSFIEIRDDLQQILDRRDRLQLELDGRLKRLAQERHDREATLQKLSAELSAQLRIRDDKSQEVAQKLAADPLFQEKSKLALAEEGELKENEERVVEIRRGAEEKLPAYQQSRLFQYLYRRFYGTPQYPSRGLIRAWDSKVARLIDFPRARQSYEFLQSTPRLMAEQVERRRLAFEQLMDELEEIEQRAADVAGLSPLLRQVAALEQQRTSQVVSLDEFLASTLKVEAQRQELNESRGRFYDEALERFRQFLASTSTAVLEQKARETVEPEDDGIVSRIASLNAQIDELTPRTKELTAQRGGVDERVAAIEFVVRRFQQAGFESERSSFEDGFDVKEQIERLVKGVKDKDSLWESVRQAQKSEPTWLESSVSGAGKAMDHPMTQVLLYSLVQVAGAALQSAANGAVNRRIR